MPAEDELFSAVDALLEQVAQDDLPAPAERKRLREAAGLSQAGIAKALDIRREAVGNWESGKTEPRQPKRAAYARLLKGLAARFPAPVAEAPETAAPTAPEPSSPAQPAPTQTPSPGQGDSPERSPQRPGATVAQDTTQRLATAPSPFTPTGERPAGPAWYATPTVAYAVELGYGVAPIEAYVRPDNGRYLDAWYTRLRDAYIATMADLGVTTGMGPREFLTAMGGHRRADPPLAIVLSAIKATVKGGIGKLRERPRGGGWRPGQPWPALQRPTWRPDIRAAVISKARVNMHRKMLKTAAATGQYPVAVLSDCAVYPSDGPSPLDFLPHKDGKPLPGGFRIGVSPGMVKHEGTQTALWAEGAREEHGDDRNLARYIKDGHVTAPDNGE